MTERSTRRRVVVAPPTIPRSSGFRIGWALVVLAAVVHRGVVLSSWTFFQDDWVYLKAAADMSLLDFIVQDYNSHLMPGQFLLVWLATAIAPLSYTSVVVITCALTVWMLGAWGLALRELFGERPHLLVALVLLAFGPVMTTVDLWWAASLQYLPLQAATGTCVWFLARCLMRGVTLRDVVGVTVALAVGLFFWQKAVLVVIPLAFLPLLVVPGSVRERIRTGVRCLWPAAVLTVAYLAVYLLVPRPHLDTFDTEFPRGRGLGETATFFGTAFVDVAVPAVVGGPFDTFSDAYARLTPLSGGARILVAVLAISFVVVALGWRRRALPALAMAVTYACASWATLLFSSRYDEFGIAALYESRYLCDILPVLLLAIMFIVTPLRTQDRSEALRRPVGNLALAAATRTLLVVGVAVCCLAVALSARNWSRIHDTSEKPWVDALVADATSVPSGRIYDTVAPDNVINPIFMFGRANLSDLLAPLGLDHAFNQPTQNGLLVDDGTGHLYEGEVLSPAVSSVSPGPTPGCGYLLQPGETVALPLTGSIYELEWIVQIDYFSPSGGTLRSSTDTKTVELDVEATAPGALSRVQYVVVDPVSRLDLTLVDGSEDMCVTVVNIGGLVATDRRPAPLAPLER